MSGKHTYDRSFLAAEAVMYGINEAVVLSQLRHWCSKPHQDKDEKHWVYNSYKQWQEVMPWMSESTIKRVITKLEGLGLIVSEQRSTNEGKVKFYRLNTGGGQVNLNRGSGQSDLTPQSLLKDTKSTQKETSSNLTIVSLTELEKQLPESCVHPWKNFKQEMQRGRRNKMKPGVPLKVLQEFLKSIEEHNFRPAQIIYALDYMRSRKHPIPENERYFRKSALGYLGGDSGASSPDDASRTRTQPDMSQFEVGG